MPALRRLAHKALGGRPVAGDYELHSGVAHDCRQRTPIAEAVQRELYRRHLLTLRRAASAKTAEALAAWWHEAASGDLPGALWATLSHPRCTAELEHQVLGQVHMLQHQVGVATRADLAQLEALRADNAALVQELASARERSQRLAAEQAERAATLQAEIVRLRGQRLAAESNLALLHDELQALRAAAPDLEARADLAARNARQAERIADLQRTLLQARAETERLTARPAAPAAAPGESHAAAAAAAPAAAAALANLAVLCVGGRPASVPVYRRLVEGCGGRFLHHDGGAENHLGQLESTLAAADLVICQAGCVSHNAYWRVKDHCKRTGKRCVFVETPSAAGLQRALTDIGSER
jgi:hypothetical protein